MKRLSIAALAAALMFVVAPHAHAQAAQQAKKADTTAVAKKSVKSASKSTASKSKKKARRATKAKADSAAAKKSE
jgi:hypothetical protein